MSNTNNNRNGYSVSITKPKGGGKFCKICKDVGKTLNEYTSHYVRETPNPNSRVVCPTLLTSVCRYCKEGGHTVKHCPKINTKKHQDTNTANSHIISKSYCMSTTKPNKKTSDNQKNYSAFSVLDFSSDEEEDTKEEDTKEEDTKEEDIVTPPTKSVVSYASVLNKEPYNPHVPSQIESLIPIKLDFDRDDVPVTLFDITKRWADEEELNDAIILNTVVAHPFPYDVNHPLTRFVSFTDALASDYTNGFTKSIAITSDAFQQLSKNWETKFFDTNGGKNILDSSQETNARARSVIMTERYIR